MEVIIAGQFKIVKKIGAGSFGEIFQAVSVKRGHKVAIKLENCQSKYQQLEHEGKVLSDILGTDSITDKGIPNLHAKGKEGQFNYIVIDMLGLSLSDLLQKNEGAFSLKTAIMVADQMLKRIEYVHSKGYLHRDIKPENFVTSMKQDRKIYLIDYGLAKRYSKNGKHIAYEEGKSLIGTVRYASLNTHFGIQPTRRDDLQSWFYCLFHFTLGSVPWQGQKAPTRKQKYEKIMGIKMQCRPEILCKNLPPEFQQMLTYIRSLKFDEKPNYELLKNLLKSCMKSKGYEYDYYYDWEAKKDTLSRFEAEKTQ